MIKGERMTKNVINIDSSLKDFVKRKILSLGFSFYKKYYNFLNKGEIFFRAEIETTSFCNRRCKYCPNSIYDRGIEKNFMNEELWTKIMKELNEMHWHGFIQPVGYGEPLADPRMPQLLAITKKYLPKCKVVIYTNGDYLTEEVYNKLRPYVSGYKVANHGDFNTNIPKKKNIAIENIKYFSNRASILPIKNDVKLDKCDLPAQLLQVDWEGNVKLCCNDYLGKVRFGDLNKERLIDIWNKPEYKKIRKDITNGKPAVDLCKKCFLQTNP